MEVGGEVSPDDLARAVDAECHGVAAAGQGIVEGDVGAAGVEEAVEAVAVIPPDDLARVVDAECFGAEGGGGQGIV